MQPGALIWLFLPGPVCLLNTAWSLELVIPPWSCVFVEYSLEPYFGHFSLVLCVCWIQSGDFFWLFLPGLCVCWIQSGDFFWLFLPGLVCLLNTAWILVLVISLWSFVFVEYSLEICFGYSSLVLWVCWIQPGALFWLFLPGPVCLLNIAWSLVLIIPTWFCVFVEYSLEPCFGYFSLVLCVYWIQSGVLFRLFLPSPVCLLNTVWSFVV